MDKEQDGLVEQRIVFRASRCGHHPIDKCQGCEAAYQSNDSRIQQLEAQLSTAREDALREAAGVVEAIGNTGERSTSHFMVVNPPNGTSINDATRSMVVATILALIQTPTRASTEPAALRAREASHAD